MPPRKYNKTLTTKRKPYKKKKKPKALVNYKRPTSFGPLFALRGAMPNTYKTTLNYVSHETMDPSAATLSRINFSCNGMFDPYLPTGGHQPMVFDAMMAQYKKYTVIGSRIRVQFANNNSTIPAAYCCGVSLCELASPFQTSLEKYIENGNCTWKTFAPQSSGMPLLISKWSPKAFNGINKIMDNGAYAGTVSANPEKGAEWQIWVGALDTADIPGIIVQIFVEYQIIFHEPLMQVLS